MCRGQLAESAQTLTQRSFNRAQVVLLMIDALTASQKDGVTRRELALASNVIAEGRALVVLMNKFDAVPDHLKLEVTCSLCRPCACSFELPSRDGMLLLVLKQSTCFHPAISEMKYKKYARHLEPKRKSPVRLWRGSPVSSYKLCNGAPRPQYMLQ